MKLAFISDLHLSSNTFENNQLFYKIMDNWQHELDALYILGDLFEHWMGDDDSNAFITEMEQTFKKFSQHTPIYFIHGNHDFGLGKVFAKKCGITILPDCTTITVKNQRILLSHGDIFCTLDKSYQRMKKILRNPLLVFILRRTPLSWRYKLRDLLEHESSKAFNTKPESTYLVVDSTIQTIATKKEANIVIHGHTHKPGRYVINNQDNNEVVRYEIPDWVDRTAGGYILVEDEHIKIHLP